MSENQSEIDLSWLPDWSDESQYPDPENTCNRQWAWEFLRRNPEYQKAYKEYVLPNNRFFDVNICRHFEEHFLIKWPLDPVQGYWGRKEINEEISIQALPFFTNIIPYEVGFVLDAMGRKIKHSHSEEILVRIDKGAPLGPQLKSIKAHIKSRPVIKSIRLPSWKYILYLRLLDLESSATEDNRNSSMNKLIGEKAYRGNSEASDIALTAAKKIRDSGYRQLAFL